ncbi:MAG TPA: GntR family transcriptional regulator [Xanthobacteraceae bacterium]|jgi:GntR family transcriptional regulator|nr:GntR family transcriptional regulator [Xanthobacteraceae bacterium]
METRNALGFRPLYRQARDVLVGRINDGTWQAGQAIPSEMEIAADLGISPGTARKALDEMESENLVIRHQGRGTFVARHDDARIIFQFFKLTPDSGVREFPTSKILRTDVGTASAEAAKILKLRAGARVLQIERIRSFAGKAVIAETITLPYTPFTGAEKLELPNNLYELYRSRFGVTIARSTEKLKAVAAKRREEKHLGVKVGAPLLSIDRTAFSLDGKPTEWRVSVCRTDITHYLSDLK